jgi:hypothetical protein
VVYDTTNLAQNRTLPAISYAMTSIKRDNDRIFNKHFKFAYKTLNGDSIEMQNPIPITMEISVAII